MIVYLKENGARPTPSEVGLKDFYHNEKGEVDYAVFINPNTGKPDWWSEEYAEELKDVKIPKRRAWIDEPLNTNGMDNLTAERERHAARCYYLKEQEKWEQLFN